MSSLYNRATSLLLAAQATPLLLSPSLVAYLLSSSSSSGPSSSATSPIAALLARLLALALLLLAFLVLLLSGEGAALYAAADGAENTGDAPYAGAARGATLVYHVAAGVVMYASGAAGELSGAWLVLGAVAHLSLAAMGLLVVLFGQGPGHISRRTGADKRTSGFPFKNREAEKRKL